MSRDTETVAVEATDTSTETAPDANTSNEATQTQGNESGEQSSATPTDGAATPAGPTAEEINAAMEAFENLVEETLGTPPTVENPRPGKINTSNGEVPAEDMAKIVEAYKTLPGGTRVHNKAQAHLQGLQMEALTEHMWAVGARALALILTELKTAGKGTKPRTETVAKPTVSPTEAHVSLAVAHVLSVNFLTVGEGVDANWATMVQDKAQSLSNEVGVYRAYLDEKAAYDALSDEEKANKEEPTAPEVDQIIVQAARLARGRVAGPRKATTPKATSGAVTPREPRDPNAPRGNILEHIREVFEKQPVGTFLKVGEIAKVATGQYPGGNASGGAVSSRIEKPTFVGAIPGLEYVDSPNKGVRKVA